MKHLITTTLFALLLAIPLSSSALFGKDDPDKQREGLQDQRKVVLEKLYEEKPDIQNEIK